MPKLVKNVNRARRKATSLNKSIEKSKLRQAGVAKGSNEAAAVNIVSKTKGVQTSEMKSAVRKFVNRAESAKQTGVHSAGKAGIKPKTANKIIKKAANSTYKRAMKGK